MDLRSLIALAAALLLVSAGCATNRREAPPSFVEDAPIAASQPVPAGAAASIMVPDERAAAIAADPLAFLRSAAQRCAALEQYTLTLIRSERRGLLRAMHGPERISAWFRRTPFSVKFVWLDPDIKYGESTYVAGQHDNQVRFTPRRPVFGFKPGVVKVHVNTPVVWGEARHPVTDFGLENLLVRTLEKIDNSAGDFQVAYRGLRTHRATGRRVHEVYVRVPVPNRPSKQELYIDVATELPLATRVLNEDGSLEAEYQYLDLDAQVALSDDDFLLELERRAAAAAGGANR